MTPNSDDFRQVTENACDLPLQGKIMLPLTAASARIISNAELRGDLAGRLAATLKKSLKGREE